MVHVKMTAGDVESGVAWNPSTAGAKTEGTQTKEEKK